MKITHRGAVSLTGTLATTRIRVPSLAPGTHLIPLGPPLAVVGCWPHDSTLTAYVVGTMPAAMRTAVEENRTHEEEWFGPVPAGIQEIDLSECRYDYLVQQPTQALPLFPQEVSTQQAA